MEIQLQDLIEQIKKEGVETAKTQADAILTAAKTEAEQILADAQAAADKLMQDAKAANERTVKAGEEAIRQAGRNLLLSFRESVTRELNAIVGEQVAAICASDDLAKLIVCAVEHWVTQPDAQGLDVILTPSDLQRLEETLLAQFKARALTGVTLKANSNFDGGFRLAPKDSGIYYDYSSEAVCEMLANYLSPSVSALLKEAE